MPYDKRGGHNGYGVVDVQKPVHKKFAKVALSDVSFVFCVPPRQETLGG